MVVTVQMHESGETIVYVDHEEVERHYGLDEASANQLALDYYESEGVTYAEVWSWLHRERLYEHGSRP